MKCFKLIELIATQTIISLITQLETLHNTKIKKQIDM